MDWQNEMLCEYGEVRKFQLREFTNYGVEKRYPKNTLINLDKHENILIIINGRVKISTTSENGNEKILYILSTGDLIGEIDLFTKVNHDYEITTLVKTEVRVLSREIFIKKVSSNPQIYENIIKSIIRKYHIVSSQLIDNVFMDSYGKIASVLLRLSEQEGMLVGRHVEYSYLKHQDIADLLGCSRVTISKALKKFKSQGIIDIKDNKIIILDKGKLKSYM